MDWCDEYNFGVTHFGFDPQLFPIESIGIDIFHCSGAITRKIMAAVCNFMMMQDPKLKFKFSELLKTFWKKYRVLIWNMYRPFQSFIGRELLAFILNSQKIVTFLETEFQQTESITALCKCLMLWKDISKFLVISAIPNIVEYEQQIKQFKTNIHNFFGNARLTFIMTKNELTPGDNETFYLHALRCYFPQLAIKLYKKHHMGLGIFTMQGFERRNKE